MPPPEKNIPNPSEALPDQPVQILNFEDCVVFLNKKGRELYGIHFKVNPADYEIIYKILLYTIRDEVNAPKYGIDLSKGLLLAGPVGCGKSALMRLMNYFHPPQVRYPIKCCRDVCFDFMARGYEALHTYSYQSFVKREGVQIPRTWCFDDLGSESNLKYYGNECNVMGEILLNRYDLFVHRDMITHLTTNLSAAEIEDFYGNRVRSRMRQMFNLISFDKGSKDKRV